MASAVAADGEPEKNEARERERLGHGEDVLHQRAELHTEDIHGGKENDNGDSGKIRGADADLHIAQDHGAERNGRNVRDVPQPMRAGDRWKKTPRNLPKATQTAAMVPVSMTRKSVQP